MLDMDDWIQEKIVVLLYPNSSHFHLEWQCTY